MKSQLHIILFCIISFGASKNLIAQSDFYDIDHVPEIRLYFSQSNWDEVLDSLYLLGEDYRLGADCTIDGISYKKVGVRYKGFSSYSSSRNKNPLNIDLDFVFNEQSHQGFYKIKLSNVIQDPSFVREALSYEIAQKYMPASRANYANVYINEMLVGLYTNVEAVDVKFLQEHFGSSGSTFIKCNPETISLNGENANLSNTLGNNIADYQSLYNMKSSGSNDWNNLYEFIDVLNEDPNNVESVLNIDRTLWMHAFNYSLINFDSYVGYAQNYYLFQDLNGQFNPILWDLNMSFASYRLTDASDYWDGFSITEAKTIDPLQHLNSFSIHPRPLIKNLIQTPMYERMYMAHLITIIEENFENGLFETRGNYFQSIIDASVQADTNKFYSYTDFIDNLDSTVADLVEYPGIIDLMEDRTTYLMSFPGVQYRPDIDNIYVSGLNDMIGEDFYIGATITGAVENAYLAYRFSESEIFTIVLMYDDGNHNDGTAGDYIYAGFIPSALNSFQYYIYAENDSSGRFSPARAAYEFYSYDLEIRENDLVINELMAVNAIETDDFGVYNDWVEIYNTTDYSIPLENYYLSNDESNLSKWNLPSIDLEAERYAIIWMGDSLQDDYHANFELEFGDTIWISNGTIGGLINWVIIGEQNGVTSYARFPNGSGDFQEMIATPMMENVQYERALLDDAVFIFPNPSNGAFSVKTNQEYVCYVDVYSVHGRKVIPTKTLEGNSMITIEAGDLADGIYLVHVSFNGENSIKKIMITH